MSCPVITSMLISASSATIILGTISILDNTYSVFAFYFDSSTNFSISSSKISSNFSSYGNERETSNSGTSSAFSSSIT